MKVTFTIEYNTCWGESLALVLNDVKYPMAWGEGGKWSVTLNVRAADLKEYGYVVMRDGVIQRMEWSSHSSALPSRSPKTIADKWIDCPYPGCPFVRRHQVEKFDRPGFRGAGVVVPVFSLRTSEDFGIGEFCDLKAVVDWAAATGLCIIQHITHHITPINHQTSIIRSSHVIYTVCKHHMYTSQHTIFIDAVVGNGRNAQQFIISHFRTICTNIWIS